MSITAARYLVTGRVQGVYFRDYTRRTARHLGLEGWVRNLPDGSVEARARGERERLDELKAALEDGSPMSRVDRVIEEPLDSDDDLGTGEFVIRY